LTPSTFKTFLKNMTVMTLFSLRRSMAGLAVFVGINSVKAQMIGWMLGILLVAGVVVGSLYYLTVSTTNPANGQEQQLVQQYGPVGGYVLDDNGTALVQIAIVGWYIGLASEPGPLISPPPASNSAQVSSSPAVNTGLTSNLAANGFTLQYGMSYDTNQNMMPWIGTPPTLVSSNTPVEPVGSGNPSVTCDTLYCTSNSAAFTVSADGLTWCFSGSDLADGVYTNYWLGAQTVVIQRTTDFVNWSPIFTNGIGMNTIESFTDPDPSPPPAAFYRACCLTNSP